MQQTEYPDPAQLRAYAEEPMPFHKIAGGIPEPDPDQQISIIRDNVEYVFTPESIMVEVADGERVPVSDADCDMTYYDAYEGAMNFTTEEDFIMATGHPPDVGTSWRYEATWVLGEVTINC